MNKTLRMLGCLAVLAGSLALTTPIRAADTAAPANPAMQKMHQEGRALHEKLQQDHATLTQDREQAKALHEKMREEHMKKRQEHMAKMKAKREEMIKNHPAGTAPKTAPATDTKTPAPATPSTSQ
jgi:hypothetical protein